MFFCHLLKTFFWPIYLYKMLCYTLRDSNQMQDLDSYNKHTSTCVLSRTSPGVKTSEKIPSCGFLES